MSRSLPSNSKKSRHQAIVLTTPAGRIQFASPSAKFWLRQFFGRPPRSGQLPAHVCSWLAQYGRAKPRNSLMTSRGDSRLYLKRENFYKPHTVSLLLELIQKDNRERSRRHRDLTPREHEVLSWFSRGKLNAEIASILGLKI